jgi:hypothetical protein
MAISTVGQGVSAQALRHALATALVFLGLFFYLYGPPLTPRLTQAAHDRCNALTGERFRDYRLEWRTTSLTQIAVPSWICHDVGPHDRAVDLGWWAGL